MTHMILSIPLSSSAETRLIITGNTTCSLGGMCMNHALHSTNIPLSFC